MARITIRNPFRREADIMNTTNEPREPTPRWKVLLRLIVTAFFVGIFVLISIYFVTLPDPSAVFVQPYFWNMCVCYTFSAIESIIIIYLFCRQKTDLETWCLPYLATFAIIELCKGTIWLDSPAEFAEVAKGECKGLNQFLTHLILICLLLQPFFINLMCWKTTVDAEDTQQRFVTPIAFSVIFGVTVVGMFFWGVGGDRLPKVDVVNAKDGGDIGNIGLSTCTYQGLVLQQQMWMFKFPFHYTSPTQSLYFMLMLLSSSAIFAVPRHRVCTPIAIFHIFPFILLSATFTGSWEFASVWTWSALLTHVYFAIHSTAFDYDDGFRGNEAGICGCLGSAETTQRGQDDNTL